MCPSIYSPFCSGLQQVTCDCRVEVNRCSYLLCTTSITVKLVFPQENFVCVDIFKLALADEEYHIYPLKLIYFTAKMLIFTDVSRNMKRLIKA